MSGQKHQWTFSENVYCVEVVFENFVIKKYHLLNSVIEEIYRNFNGAIKKSSIIMKLQNIKTLLNEYKIENTLNIAPLGHVSADNQIAFEKVYEKYEDKIKTAE